MIKIILISILLIGCAPQAKMKIEIFEGIYTTGMEHQGFKVNGSEEEWWVEGKVGELNKKSYAPQADGTFMMAGQASVKIKGYVSEPGRHGQYGHMGLWERKITVTEILEIERLSP